MSFTGITSALAQQGGRYLHHGVPAEDTGRPADIRRLTVTADDGVDLYVEVQETPGASVTVVFCHGYLLNSTAWDVQRRMLAGKARVVTWDHRGHGKSGWGTPPNATMEQLGRDLGAVIRATAPRGRVILVGHSMGGMGILALAKAHPELFGDRVAGVMLSSTSAGGLSAVTAGLPPRTGRMMVSRVVPVTLTALRRYARVVDGARRTAGGATYLITWPYLYGSRVPRPVARLTTRLMASVPIHVIAEFYAELIRYDLHEVLPVLGRVPVVVMVGERDMITPVSHAQAMVTAIPGAELVVIPDSGHLLVLERQDEVAERLRDLISRATAPKRINGARGPAGRAVRPRVTQGRIDKPVRRDRHRT